MAQAPQSKSRSSAPAAEATPDSQAQTSPEGTDATDATDASAADPASDPNATAEPAAVSSHPHFDDGGAHTWETEFVAAIARARAERKLVFIEMGREQCSQCRALVQNVLTRPEIHELVHDHYVVLASDCDEPEDEVFDLAHKLEDAMMLPFVLI
ncbi:MAG: thioredoxin family protein, partial [Planctomycetota bacterium]